ncbi:hypothetical protein KCU85_g8841, partial [Aureobasidium melanogenum]
MHNFTIQATLVFFTLGTISAVASPADMFTALMLPSLLSKPNVSIQTLCSGAEGNTTADDSTTAAKTISSGNKEDNQAALNTQPSYCPDSYETMPMCVDCGGFTLFYYRELDWYDTRCKGVGDDEDLKDCLCLERRHQEDDDIVCDIFAADPDPDPEATRRKTVEAMIQVPDSIIDPITGTELNQPHIVLDDDFWAATVQEIMDQEDKEQEDECLPKESI